MKKISLLVILLMHIGAVMAQNSSTLTVFAEEGTPFYLILNGIRQNDIPETNIRVEGLTEPHYAAKVVFENQQMGYLEKKYMQIKDVDGNNTLVTYKIKRNNKGELKIRVFSMTPIAQAPATASNVTVIQYNSTPKPAVTTVSTTETYSTTTSTNGGNRSNDNVNLNVNVDGINMGINVNVNDAGGMNTQQTHTSTTTYTTQNTTAETTNPMPGYNGRVGCNSFPMAHSDFSEAKRSVSNQTFKAEKLTVAKQIANSNCFTATQVKEILQQFTFEDNKLEFAKYAYAHTYDIGNYYKVNDVFDFSSSVDKLNKFIGQ
jgi:hypothetical protein